MFDAKLRPLIDPPLNKMGKALARLGVGADAVTIAGAALGIIAGVAIANGEFAAGLALILFSRLLDGLDGAIARATKITDFGGYLDIVADFVFYVAIPIGFGFAATENALYAMVLLGAFALTGVSFLGFAAIAARRGLESGAHGRKSLFYSTGIAEGAETIAVFVLMCLAPGWFPEIASVYAAICALTVIQRSLAARKLFE